MSKTEQVCPYCFSEVEKQISYYMCPRCELSLYKNDLVTRPGSDFMTKEYSRPLPEILDGDDWEARNSGDLKKAYVDFEKKEFVVPFVVGSSGELVRAHEAMHVKISPKPKEVKFSEADFVTYQALEDTRVNQALRFIGIKTDNGRVYTKKEIENLLADPTAPQKRTPLRLAETYFATKGLAEEESVREIVETLRPEVLPIADDVYEKYFGARESAGERTPWDEIPKAIKELKERLREIEKEEEQRMDRAQQIGQSQRGYKNITGSFVPGDSDGSDTQREMVLPTITPEERAEIGSALPRDTWPDSYGEDPGEMEVFTPKLDQILKLKKVKSIKSSPSDEGVIPIRMHRYATDMKLFSRPGRRRTNAAVLIDISGSMSLTDDQIKQIIAQCPDAIIAVYCGYSRKGGLAVVAHKGRWTTNFRHGRNMRMSNIVDVHAVAWLAKRKEKKKLWISDGIVTGCDDGPLRDIYVRKLVRTIKDGKIERVGNVKSLLQSGKLIDSAFDDGYAVGQRYKAKA